MKCYKKMGNKWNEGVLGQANHQAFIVGLA
jgi:hypothetical protein